MSEIYRENIIKLRVGPQHIRCWIDQPTEKFDPAYLEDASMRLHARWSKFWGKDASKATQAEIAEHLLAADGVNAVEVIDALGAGVVYYKDWP